MATGETKYEPYIKRDRVTSSTFLELVVCSLCQGILWVPKACKDCQAPYCLTCIKNRQADTSEPIRCPNICSGFVEHKCPTAVLHILSRLEVKCRNTMHGCNEILPYNSLETHEEECGYRQKPCSGCEKEFAKKDFQEHHSTCPLVSLTCPECNTVYQRKDEKNHTEIICLRIQLRQQKEKLDQVERIVARLNIQSPNISEVND